MDLTRDQVLRYRVHAQQLHRSGGHEVTDADVLDLGVQDTGTDGALWSLANRGVEVSAEWPDDLALAWTLRGAPHAYRRDDLAAVAAATAPVSEADAAKRVFDAAKPLREAGIPVLTALDVLAGHLRDIVVEPTVKGEMSAALRERVDAPYLRHCRPCNAIHSHEQTFRLAALRGGLELTPGTSPPVLRRIPGWTGPAPQVPERLDVTRAFLHLHGPSTRQHVAAYLDSPVKDVTAHWPADAVPVRVDGEQRWVLEDDVPALADGPSAPDDLRLLPAFDPLLQTRDRELLVPDPERRTTVWVTLGRPGAVLHGHQIVGSWRPRASGRRLGLVVDLWSGLPLARLTDEAERLAAFRGLTLSGLSAA